MIRDLKHFISTEEKNIGMTYFEHQGITKLKNLRILIITMVIEKIMTTSLN
jgi:hypothetical protein